MDRVHTGKAVVHHRVARLVVGGQPPLVFRHHPALLLRPGDDLDHRLLEVRHGDELLVLPGGQKGPLVDQVLQVRAGEAAGPLGQDPQVHVLGERLVAHMDRQDLLPAPAVGTAHVDLPVEPSGTQQGGIQNVRPVGGRQDHHAGVAAEAVHLHQQLVEGLLPLIVAAAQARAPLASHGVDLIDEHHRGGHLLGLLEEVPHPAGAHAHVQLHEVGAGDGQELDPGLPGHGLGQQGLAGARRAHQQHALGDPGPQFQILFGLFEEAHDFPQLLLLLVGPGHIGEADLVLAVGPEADAGLAETPALVHAAAPLGPDHHILPGQEDAPDEEHIEENLAPPGRLVDGTVVVIHDHGPVLLVPDQVSQLLPEQLRAAQLVVDRGAVPQGQVELVPVLDDEAVDLLPLEQVPHLGEGDVRRAGCAEEDVVGAQKHQQDGKIEPDAGPVSLFRQKITPLDRPRASRPRCRANSGTSGSSPVRSPPRTRPAPQSRCSRP